MPIYGPKWPLKIDNEDTYDLNTTMVEQVNYNLKCILLTSPGENISDAGYGVGLRLFLFEPNIDITHNQITKRIRNQVSFYEPRISLVDVIVLTDSEEIGENSLSIKIIYSLENELKEYDLSLKNNSQIGYS